MFFDIHNTKDGAILLRVYRLGKIDHYLRLAKNPIRTSLDWEQRADYREYHKDTPAWLVSKWTKTDVHDVSGGFRRDGDFLCEGSFESCAGYLLNYTVGLAGNKAEAY